jgi:hypothetical protein
MKIKSFGCSFIYGTDLGDNPHIWKYSELTWPAILANQLGYDYECYARPGSGNLQIAERVLNECNKKDSVLYIINWTWIDRFDFVKSEDQWQPWDTLRPTSTERHAESYYKNLHSEYRDKLTTLISVKTVIDILLEKGIKFIMTYEDDLLFDQRWHTSLAVKELQNAVSKHMTTFEGQGFLSWSRKNNYPISEAWHPLEEAHSAAADYMISVFDKQKIIDPVLQAHV